MEGEVHLIESGPLRSCILVFRLSIPQGEGGVEGACAPAPVCSQGKGHPGFTPWLLHVCAAAIASLGMPPGALRWQGSQAEGGGQSLHVHLWRWLESAGIGNRFR